MQLPGLNRKFKCKDQGEGTDKTVPGFNKMLPML